MRTIEKPNITWSDEQIQAVKDKFMELKCNKQEYAWYKNNEHILERIAVNGYKEIWDYPFGSVDGVIRIYKKYEATMKNVNSLINK